PCYLRDARTTAVTTTSMAMAATEAMAVTAATRLASVAATRFIRPMGRCGRITITMHRRAIRRPILRTAAITMRCTRAIVMAGDPAMRDRRRAGATGAAETARLAS